MTEKEINEIIKEDNWVKPKKGETEKDFLINKCKELASYIKKNNILI